MKPPIHLKLVEWSGRRTRASGAIYAQPLRWGEDGLPFPTIEWMPRKQGELVEAYLQRLDDGVQDLGIAKGEYSFGIRRAQKPGDPRRSLWKAEGVPVIWPDEFLRQALEEVGFETIDITKERPRGEVRLVHFKASTLSQATLFTLQGPAHVVGETCEV